MNENEQSGGIEVPSDPAQVPAKAGPPILKHFAWKHLPPELAAISKRFHDLAHDLADLLPSGPELSAGLRKLLESKDCAVRTARGE
jgi:hypothetical protein